VAVRYAGCQLQQHQAEQHVFLHVQQLLGMEGTLGLLGLRHADAHVLVHGIFHGSKNAKYRPSASSVPGSEGRVVTAKGVGVGAMELEGGGSQRTVSMSEEGPMV
jgi:hypothetical protein